MPVWLQALSDACSVREDKLCPPLLSKSSFARSKSSVGTQKRFFRPWSMESTEEMLQEELDESELERFIVRGWRERSRELIPETRGSKAYWKEWSVIRWDDDVDGRAWPKIKSDAARRLNCDEVMQIWMLGGCENFVGKWKGLYSMHYGPRPLIICCFFALGRGCARSV